MSMHGSGSETMVIRAKPHQKTHESQHVVTPKCNQGHRNNRPLSQGASIVHVRGRTKSHSFFKLYNAHSSSSVDTGVSTTAHSYTRWPERVTARRRCITLRTHLSLRVTKLSFTQQTKNSAADPLTARCGVLASQDILSPNSSNHSAHTRLFCASAASKAAAAAAHARCYPVGWSVWPGA